MLSISPKQKLVISTVSTWADSCKIEGDFCKFTYSFLQKIHQILVEHCRLSDENLPHYDELINALGLIVYKSVYAENALDVYNADSICIIPVKFHEIVLSALKAKVLVDGKLLSLEDRNKYNFTNWANYPDPHITT
jgi:hypothetical protein